QGVTLAGVDGELPAQLGGDPVGEVLAVVRLERRQPVARVLVGLGPVAAGADGDQGPRIVKSLAKASRSLAVHCQAPESHASASGTRWSMSSPLGELMY